MTTNQPTDERSIDTAERIARERLADDLDPREFGDADDLAEMLAEVAADLREDDLTVHRLDAACVHLTQVQKALRDASELHGWGWEEHTDAHPQPEPDIEPDTEPEGFEE